VLDINRVKHRKADADGPEVFYREAGRSAAPAVLLLHGFPSSSHGFRDVMSPLAEVARVIAPDPLG
jgi:pimeloyl-ACP methyl ester carboxylesterase